MFCQKLGFQVSSHVRKLKQGLYVFDTFDMKILIKKFQFKTCSILYGITISSPYCFSVQVLDYALFVVQKTNAQSA